MGKDEGNSRLYDQSRTSPQKTVRTELRARNTPLISRSAPVHTGEIPKMGFIERIKDLKVMLLPLNDGLPSQTFCHITNVGHN